MHLDNLKIIVNRFDGKNVSQLHILCNIVFQIYNELERT